MILRVPLQRKEVRCLFPSDSVRPRAVRSPHCRSRHPRASGSLRRKSFVTFPCGQMTPEYREDGSLLDHSTQIRTDSPPPEGQLEHCACIIATVLSCGPPAAVFGSESGAVCRKVLSNSWTANSGEGTSKQISDDSERFAACGRANATSNVKPVPALPVPAAKLTSSLNPTL